MNDYAFSPKSIDILLVEDSATDRLIAVETLRASRMNNALHCVGDGEEAMAFLRREGKYKDAPRPDLILLDLNLPRKDGREVLAEVKSDEYLRLIPVVVLTTSKADEDVLEAYGLHANCYVTKPLDFERFTQIAKQLENFWFEVVTLPPQAALAQLARSRPSAVVPSQPLFGADRSYRVLIVEDSPSDTLLIEDALAESKLVRFESTRAARLVEAETLLAKNSFDVIVTDLGLPDSQGVETLAQLRRVAGVTPIIVLTMMDDEATGLDLLHKGAMDYIVKGQISARALSRSIRYALDRSNIEIQLRHAQKMESLGTLAGGVAHDFNNLLTIIRGNAQLQQHDGLSPESTKNAATQILAATDRAAALTRQLLAFSRRQMLSLSPLDLNTVVGDFTKMLRRLLGPTIQMELQLAAEPLEIAADAGMIEQVVMNLAINARDAMPAGGRLTVKTESRTITAEAPSFRMPVGPGDYVCLCIADTGTGISPNDLDRIFEPFYTTKEFGQGTGLGLATVHGIVEQHRGTVQVRSTVGVGTQFTILLPRGKPHAVKQVEAPAQLTQNGGETILLVDDEDGIREIAKMMLQMKGYTVIDKRSGAEALADWSKHQADVDLLITDMLMPEGISGSELGRVLTESKPGLKVVYCSGYSTGFGNKQNPLSVKLEEGVNFLPKPYCMEQLLTIIRRRLDQ